MNHLSEEDLILLYYGEPGMPENAREHLSDCGECRAAADSLARTLDLCSKWSVPEPSPAFERSVWAQLAPQIENRPRRWFVQSWFVQSWFVLPRLWIAVAAAAMLLIAAFLTGRASRTAQPSIVAGLSSQARERILEISLADHLDRASMLLTEISNTDEAGAADFATERDRAHDLVEEGRLLHQTFARQGASASLTFLDDLERVLTEVSHAANAREIQGRIGSGSLVFKVRIIESNLRTQGQKS